MLSAFELEVGRSRSRSRVVVCALLCALASQISHSQRDWETHSRRQRHCSHVMERARNRGETHGAARRADDHCACPSPPAQDRDPRTDWQKTDDRSRKTDTHVQWVAPMTGNLKQRVTHTSWTEGCKRRPGRY